MSEPRTTHDTVDRVPGAAPGPIPATGQPGVEAFGYQQELKRSLSFTDLLVYGLIFMVPIAPFGIFGSVFQASGGMVALVYAIGGLAMAFTAASYSQMSRAFPMAGSVYTYAGRGIAQPVGFIAGWMILLDYVLVPALLYLIASVAMNSIYSSVPVLVWLIGVRPAQHRRELFRHRVHRAGQQDHADRRAHRAGDLPGDRRGGAGQREGARLRLLADLQQRHLLAAAGLRRRLHRGPELPGLRRDLHAGRGEPGVGTLDRQGDDRRSGAGRCPVHRADLGGRPAGAGPGPADRGGRRRGHRVLRRRRCGRRRLAGDADRDSDGDRLGLRELAGGPGRHLAAAVRDGPRSPAARLPGQGSPDPPRAGQRHLPGRRDLTGPRLVHGHP